MTEFVCPEINNSDIYYIDFQQDGATYHFPKQTIQLMKEKVNGRVNLKNEFLYVT